MSKSQVEHRKVLGSVIRAAKNRPCLDCGHTFPYFVMDLDHVRGEKKFSVAEALGRNVSLEELLEEIAKCDAVCSNCHRIRTFNRGGAGKAVKKQSKDI